MLTKKKIIAIFTANYFFEELIKLLKEEGLEIERKKNPNQLTFPISNQILLVDIDSKKRFLEIKKLLNNRMKNCNVFFQNNTTLDIEFDGLTELQTPLVFRDFQKQIDKISKSKKNLKFIKIGEFDLYHQTFELINNLKNKKIRLTELESRFLKFLAENKYGLTKSELLAKVWGHNTILDTHTLESLIYRVRKKIEKNPNKPQIVVFKDKKYYVQ